MEKTLLFLTMMSLGFASAQTTLFQENWDGAGPGISAWTLYNVDGKTPVSVTAAGGDGLPALVTNAWNVLSQSDIVNSGDDYYGFSYPAGATGMAGNVAVSNSWYDPAGASNDWLVSPQINIPSAATGVTVKWAATSLGSSSYLEDYKVYISTTGNQVSNFTTILKTVANEFNTGTYHSVDLSAYVGQNIYIAFRNDSNDQYIMLLDNIMVESQNTLALSEAGMKTKVSMYPNPTTDILNIEGFKKSDKIQVVDGAGRMINVKVVDGKVDVSTFAKGTYLLKVESQEGTTQHKFIKK